MLYDRGHYTTILGRLSGVHNYGLLWSVIFEHKTMATKTWNREVMHGLPDLLRNLVAS